MSSASHSPLMSALSRDLSSSWSTLPATILAATESGPPSLRHHRTYRVLVWLIFRHAPTPGILYTIRVLSSYIPNVTHIRCMSERCYYSKKCSLHLCEGSTWTTVWDAMSARNRLHGLEANAQHLAAYARNNISKYKKCVNRGSITVTLSHGTFSTFSRSATHPNLCAHMDEGHLRQERRPSMTEL